MLINSFYFRNCVTLCLSCSQLLGQLPGKLQQSSIYLSIYTWIVISKLKQSSIYLYILGQLPGKLKQSSIYISRYVWYIYIYLFECLSVFLCQQWFIFISIKLGVVSIYISIQSHLYIYSISSIYLSYLIYISITSHLLIYLFIY